MCFAFELSWEFGHPHCKTQLSWELLSKMTIFNNHFYEFYQESLSALLQSDLDSQDLTRILIWSWISKHRKGQHIQIT